MNKFLWLLRLTTYMYAHKIENKDKWKLECNYKHKYSKKISRDNKNTRNSNRSIILTWNKPDEITSRFTVIQNSQYSKHMFLWNKTLHRKISSQRGLILSLCLILSFDPAQYKSCYPLTNSDLEICCCPTLLYQS